MDIGDNLPPDDDFPALHAANHEITSLPSPFYNCAAWAAGVTRPCWWPDRSRKGYWPPGVAREVTIPAFIAAYGTLGYVPCDHGDPEPGFEKIALYAIGDLPKHVARQRPDGWWSSKIGQWVDIKHTAEALDGPLYGRMVGFLKRIERP